MTVESTIERVARAIYDAADKEPEGYAAPYREWGFEASEYTLLDGHFRLNEFALAALSILRPGDPLPGGMEAQQGWRPIETAPKDGSEIIGFDSGRDAGVYVVKWYDDAWIEAGGEEYGKWSPTHWRPLPTPPTSLSNQETKAE